jgi:hypothetical protein
VTATSLLSMKKVTIACFVYGGGRHANGEGSATQDSPKGG